MEFLPFLQAIGLAPSWSTKPASTLFVISLLVSFNQLSTPGWLFGWTPALILLVMALTEWQVGKDMMVMDLLESFMPLVKGVLAVVITLSLLDANTAQVLEYLRSDDPGFLFSLLETAAKWVYGLVTGVATWYITIYRDSYKQFFGDFDEDNDVGLLSLYGWAELFFAVGNGVLAIFFPVVAIGLFLLTAVSLRLLRRYLEKQETKKKRLCANGCGTDIFGSALVCPTCDHPNPAPLRVGLLGQTTNQPVKNKGDHHWQLLAQKRCPRCATHFYGRTMHQVCTACGQNVLDSPAAVKAYVQHFDGKLWSTMALCAAMGFVPFVGIVAGVVTYRLRLVSPMRRYVPVMQGCLGRWTVRLINLFLVSLQAIPFAGLLILPLMCFFNFQIYRSLMMRSQSRFKAGAPSAGKLA